jgi:hypothetical protein
MPSSRKIPNHNSFLGSSCDPLKPRFYRAPVRVCCVLALLISHPLQAQTISEYSRSQRAVIEAEMNRNTARALNASAHERPAPAVQASQTPNLPPPLPAGFEGVPALSAAPRSGLPLVRPNRLPAQITRSLASQSIAVAGVFISVRKVVTQITVDGQDHLLSLGQAVPGTAWQVQAISAHQVVLERVNRNGQRASRVFKLPSA